MRAIDLNSPIRATGIVLVALLSVILLIAPLASVYAEIQATPVIEPTSAPTETPVTPELMETPGSVGTPDATPGKQSSSLISPQNVSPGTRALTGCNQIPAGLTIAPGGSVKVACELQFNILDGLLQRAHVQRPNLTSQTYFDAAINIDGGLLSGLTIIEVPRGDTVKDATVALSLAGLGLETIQVEITIWADDDTPPGSRLDATFSVCKVTWLFNPPSSCSPYDDGSVTVTLEVPLAEGTHYTFECTPGHVTHEQFNPSTASLCTLEVLSAAGTTTVRLDSIIASPPDGLSGWVTLIDDLSAPRPVVSPGDSYDFIVKLTPTSCAAVSSEPAVELEIAVSPVRNGVTGASVISSAKLVSASFSAPSTKVKTSISAPDSQGFEYSMTMARDGDAEFQIALEVTGCGEWATSIKVDPFVKHLDPEYDGLVPNLTEVSHNSTSKDLADMVGGTELDSGEDPGVSDTRFHTINFEYTIPANTPVGTYISTITVTTGTAP